MRIFIVLFLLCMQSNATRATTCTDKPGPKRAAFLRFDQLFKTRNYKALSELLTQLVHDGNIATQELVTDWIDLHTSCEHPMLLHLDMRFALSSLHEGQRISAVAGMALLEILLKELLFFYIDAQIYLQYMNSIYCQAEIPLPLESIDTLNSHFVDLRDRLATKWRAVTGAMPSDLASNLFQKTLSNIQQSWGSKIYQAEWTTEKMAHHDPFWVASVRHSTIASPASPFIKPTGSVLFKTPSTEEQKSFADFLSATPDLNKQYIHLQAKAVAMFGSFETAHAFFHEFTLASIFTLSGPGERRETRAYSSVSLPEEDENPALLPSRPKTKEGDAEWEMV
jgi:hypothetical protein